jgi:hypothetical protein
VVSATKGTLNKTMVPNDINIITQAFSELSRAKALISSAEARLTSALNSTGEKTYVEIDNLNAAIAAVKNVLTELSKVKIS